MKKLISLVILFIILCSLTYAQKIKLDVSAEYATVDMKDINKQLEDLESLLQRVGLNTSLTKFSSGILVSLGLSYGITPNLSIGPKIGYLNCSPAEVYGETSIQLFGRPVFFKIKATGETSLIYPMIGAVYSATGADKINLTAGLYLGYSFANFIIKREQEMPDGTSQKFEIPYEGKNIIANISFGINYDIISNVSVGVSFGYRTAKIDELKATKDVPEANVKKGDTLKDADDKPVPADYSGINAGLKISYKF